jgi:hypothetical protein
LSYLRTGYSYCSLPDDPYYYLYYGKAPRYPSYFSLELEEPEVGRVLRFDSLSKILSAGIRMGFASGPEPLLYAIDQHVCFETSFHISYISLLLFAIDVDIKSSNFFTHANHRLQVTGFLGIRRLQDSHRESVRFLSREARHLRARYADPPYWISRVDNARSRHVCMVRPAHDTWDYFAYGSHT